MRNHLIIGLGGTGGRAIRALRKRIMLEHRSEDIPIPGSGDKNFAIKYLYVDSSDEMMKPSDKSWRVLGQSVQLPPASQLLITGASIREVLANPQTHPTIQPWLGSAEQWANVPAQVIDGGAGGQRRRLGRFLFAMKAPEFKERVGRLLGELRSQTQQSDVHVHIITGLAGGTGGGSFLDVLTHMTRNPAIVGGSRISLFAVLPERGSTWSTGNYYANGYAALRELNGLMVGKYRPYDLMSAGERVEFDQTRIKGVYLITNENESTALKVDTDVPVMVSDFLYERLLESEQGQPPLASFENSPFGNECVPETEDAQRSRRFFSFGIKRVEYPEGEIEEFLAASLAKAASLQIQYNNWTDEFGFDASKVQINHRQRVEDDELLERWRLTDDHLTYILPILDDDIERAKRWRPTIAGEWQEAIDHYQGDCRELGRTDMLPEYLTRLEEQFATKGGYRDLGVPEFYRLRNAGRTAMAARIVDLIEAELLRKWREAEVGWSLDDQVETLRTLRESLEDRRIGFDKRTSALREYVKTLEEDLTEQRDDAANTSALTWPLKKSGILQRYAVSVSDYMAARTELEAVKFAVELVPAIIEQLVQLQSMVEQVRGRVAKALENLNIAIDSRLRNDEGSAAAALRRFDPAKVSQLRDRMVRDKSEMGRIASEIRRTLLDTPKLRNSPHFRSLLEDLDGVALDQRLLERCDAEIKAVHDAVIQGDTDRVLGVKLIQRLRTEFGGDRERLDAFARELVDKAKPYILIRDVEKKRDNKTIGAGSDARLESAMVVQRPKPAGFEDFLKALDGALQNTQVGITIPDPPTSKPNALTVMSVYAGFPIRFLDVVDYLKSEYENKLKNSVGLTRLEVHTEDAGAELPDLFAVVGPPPNAMPYLLLARTFEFVLDNKNTETGRKEVVLKCKDSGGFDTLVKIADSWDDLPKNLQHKDFLTIKKMVEAKIGNDLVHQDAKKAVNATIVALVNGIGEKAGLQSAIYTEYRQAAGAVKKLLELED